MLKVVFPVFYKNTKMSVEPTEELFDQLMKNQCFDEVHNDSDDEDLCNSMTNERMQTKVINNDVTNASTPNINDNNNDHKNETDASNDNLSSELIMETLDPPEIKIENLEHENVSETSSLIMRINENNSVSPSECNTSQECSDNVAMYENTDNTLTQSNQNVEVYVGVRKSCDISKDLDVPNNLSVNTNKSIQLPEVAGQSSDSVNPNIDSSSEGQTCNFVQTRKKKCQSYNIPPPPLKRIRSEIVVVQDISDESGDGTSTSVEHIPHVSDEESQPDSIIRIPSTKPLEVLETVNVVNPYGIDLNPSTSGHYESVETITIDANQKTQDEDLPIEISSDEEGNRPQINENMSEENIVKKDSETTHEQNPQQPFSSEKTSETMDVPPNQDEDPNTLPNEEIDKSCQYLKSLRILSNLTNELQKELSGNVDNTETKRSSDSNESSINCKGCDEKFSIESFYYLHISRATSKIFYNCDECNKRICFSNPCLLKSHLKAHGKPLNSIKMSESNLNVELPSLSDFRKKCFTDSLPPEMELWANSESDEEMDYGCIECECRFRFLVEHFMFNPTNSDNYIKCPTCNLLFTSKCSFEIHKRIHIGERPYGCPDCGTTFITYNRLLAHLSLECFHIKRRIFIKCLCGVVVLDKESFKEHILTKHRFVFYKCDQCAQIFRFLSELQHHMRLKHKSILKLDDKNMFDKCGLCTVNRMYPRADYNDHLTHHIEDKATEFFSYYCRKCRLLAPNPLIFQEHMKNSSECREHELALLKKSFPQVSIPTIERTCKDYSKPEVQKIINSVYGPHKDLYLQLKNPHEGNSNKNKNSDKGEEESGTIMMCLLCRKKFATYAQIRDHILGYHKCQDQINKYIRASLHISDGDLNTSDEDPSVDEESEEEVNNHEKDKRKSIIKREVNSSVESINEECDSPEITVINKPVSMSFKEIINKKNECAKDLNQETNGSDIKQEEIICCSENVDEPENSSVKGHCGEVLAVDQDIINNCVSAMDNRASCSVEVLNKEDYRLDKENSCIKDIVGSSCADKLGASDNDHDNQESSCIGLNNCNNENIIILCDDINSSNDKLNSSINERVCEERAEKIFKNEANEDEDIIEITSDDEDEIVKYGSDQTTSEIELKSKKESSESVGYSGAKKERINCPYCDYWSCLKEQFRRHVVEHRDDNSFQCLECGVCFVYKSALEIHLVSAHSLDNPLDYMKTYYVHNSLPKPDDDMDLEPNQCPVCFEIFPDNKNFLTHFRSHGMAFLRKSFANRLGT